MAEATIGDKDPYKAHPTRLTDEDFIHIAEQATGDRERPEGIETLENFLWFLTNEITEKERAKYPFLTAFGTEAFDRRLLEKAALSHARRARDFAPEDMEGLRGKLLTEVGKIYRYHIPAYSRIFLELDKRKRAQEIYLGRDGAFMYYGRRAQLWGRGEKTQGRVIYIWYSRMTMGISETKDGRKLPGLLPTKEQQERYLREHGVENVNNAIFVDTGHKGTVPKHILRDVFGVPENEVDEKILLVASDDFPKLRVRWETEAEESRATDVANQIEKSPHLTREELGFYEDTGNSRLRPFAPPSEPIDIFAHECIKYLVMRHFYLQGRSEREGNQ